MSKEINNSRFSHLPDVRGYNSVGIFGEDIFSSQEATSFVDRKGSLLASSENSMRYRNICGSLSAVAFDKTIPTVRSAHQVGFGVLTYGQCVENDYKKQLSKVALKPHLDSSTAVNELVGYERLLSIGVNTYVPIGIFPSVNGDNLVLVTEKKSSLVSLDQHAWTSLAKISNETESIDAENNIIIINQIAELLSKLHFNGIFLPDGQIKNFAITPLGEVGAIDPENIKYKNPLDDDTWFLVITHFEKLIKSLVYCSSGTDCNDSSAIEEKIYGVGFLSQMPGERVRELVISMIIKPYLDSLDSLAIDSNSDDSMLFAEIMRKKIDDFLRINNNWPNHIVKSNN